MSCASSSTERKLALATSSLSVVTPSAVRSPRLLASCWDSSTTGTPPVVVVKTPETTLKNLLDLISASPDPETSSIDHAVAPPTLSLVSAADDHDPAEIPPVPPPPAQLTHASLTSTARVDSSLAAPRATTPMEEFYNEKDLQSSPPNPLDGLTSPPFISATDVVSPRLPALSETTPPMLITPPGATGSLSGSPMIGVSSSFFFNSSAGAPDSASSSVPTQKSTMHRSVECAGPSSSSISASMTKGAGEGSPHVVGGKQLASPWVPKEMMFRLKPCSFFFHTGRCQKGERCNFSHTLAPGMEVPPAPPTSGVTSPVSPGTPLLPFQPPPPGVVPSYAPSSPRLSPSPRGVLTVSSPAVSSSSSPNGAASAVCVTAGDDPESQRFVDVQLLFRTKPCKYYFERGHCLSSDHQILTDRGFLTLDQFRLAHVREEEEDRPLVASWDLESQRAVLEPYEALVVNEAQTQSMVEVSGVANGVSLVVTRAHDLLLRGEDVVAGECGSWKKVKAGELLLLGGAATKRELDMIVLPHESLWSDQMVTMNAASQSAVGAAKKKGEWWSVREVEYSGETWCVRVPRGLIVARRAVGDPRSGSDGFTTPVVIGNCLKGDHCNFSHDSSICTSSVPSAVVQTSLAPPSSSKR